MCCMAVKYKLCPNMLSSVRFLFCSLYLCVIHRCLAIETSLTVVVEAGARDCLHQFAKLGAVVEVEYQVIEGGDLDIGFLIKSPSGVQLITDVAKQDAVHKVTASEEGDFVFCLDNTFSRFTKKTIFFELMVDNDDPHLTYKDITDLPADNEGDYDMKLDDIRQALDKIKMDLGKSIQGQNMQKAFEARDRNAVERNFERVNLWSGIQLFVMVSVGLVQVLMIRSLFDDKSKIAQILKART